MTELDISFISRFVMNFISILVLCYGCYYRVHRNSTVAGSFILFGIGVFIITFLLHGADMSMEFAFGLFAVFTMLRYRTESISIKEMTYLFLVTAMALLSSVGQMSMIELSLINGLICAIAVLVDCKQIGKRYVMQSIQYEKIENIKPQNRQQLFSDLQQRTGLNIIDVQIEHIDFLRDTAQLSVTHQPQRSVKKANMKPINVETEYRV